MTLRLILGRAGSGKTEYCLNSIRKELRERPDGHSIILLVPEQATFQLEKELAATPGLGGLMRVQVLSFRRLAWRVFRETGAPARKHVGSIGKRMLLKGLLETNKANLNVFAQSARQPGFLDLLAGIISELKRYICTPEQILAGADFFKKSEQQLLAGKLLDLAMLYEEFEKRLENKYLDPDDYLTLLAQKLPDCDFIKDADIWLDDFTGFTPQEYLVIRQLLKFSDRVSVSLCLDPNSLNKAPDEEDCFYITRETLGRLLELSRELGVSLEDMVTLPSPGQVPYRFRQQPDLAFLEKEFFAIAPSARKHEATALTLAAAVSARAEVEGIARRIARLARVRGYRWRDIAVIVRDFEGYQELIETVFFDFGIPVFIDKKKNMLHHPLVELLISGIELVISGWAPEPLFRLLKTDLFPVERDEVDCLENYVIAHGIRDKAWLWEHPWIFRRRSTLGEDCELSYWEHEQLVAINDIRDTVKQSLLKFYQALKASRTVIEMVIAIEDLLKDLDVYIKLEHWQEAAVKQGNLQEAGEHAQVYTEVTQMLEEMIEVLGDEAIDADDFLKVLRAGLEGIELGLVPPGLDQVVVVSLGRSRTPRVKAAFLIGVVDGVLPKRPVEEGLLTEAERGQLNKTGIELAPGEDRLLLDEEYLIYTGLTRAGDYLSVSYPLADTEGRALQPSIIIDKLKTLFPRLSEELWGTEPAPGQSADYIYSGARVLPTLVKQLRTFKRGDSIDPVWFEVYNWALKHRETREAFRAMLKGVFWVNQEMPLTEATRAKMYPKQLKTSVSRLERYQQCPFSHFLNYGLKLKKRLTNKLAAPDYGQFYHAALKQFFEGLQKEQLDLASLSDEELSSMLTGVVDELAPQLQNELLLSSSRYKHLATKLQSTVKSSLLAMVNHAKRGKLRPIGLELEFGYGKMLPLDVPIDASAVVQVAGIIDRVDVASGKQKDYLMVIDYKSGDAQLRLNDIYHGLSLQLLTYLLVCLKNADLLGLNNPVPGGLCYFRIHNPLVKWNEGLDEGKIKLALDKEYKLRGMFLGETDFIQLADNGLKTGWSKVLPLGIGKEGFYKNSSVFQKEQFALLEEHFYRVVREIGSKILAGIVAIEPYKKADQSACAFCDYKDVCRFDALLPGNTYRTLAVISKDAIWESLNLLKREDLA